MKKNSNVSKAHQKYLKKIKVDKTTTLITQILIFVLFVVVWELLAQFDIIDAFFTSSPSRIYETLVSAFETGNMWYHISVTLTETCIGFALSMILGTVAAILLWFSKKVRDILDPYIVVLNALPKIALGPIIIIWVGVGTQAIIVMCILICFVITTLSLLSAFLSCDQNKIALMQSMGANKFQILTKLVLPSSLDSFLSVLKINVGMAWVGTIMGEYLSSKAGLGYLIVYASAVFQLDLVMASTVVLCVLASLMYLLVALFSKCIKRH